MTDRQLLEKILVIVNKLDKEQKANKTKWVRAATIRRELKLTWEQIRYARKVNTGIARKKESGHYEYDYMAYQQLAA